MTAHRVSLLRSSLRRHPDPARSRDPQVRALVDQLGKLPVAPGPDAAFRSELRAQLVAITPRMVAEGAEQIAREAATVKEAADDAVDEAPTPARRAAHAREARTSHFGRGLKIATATLTVLVLLLGGAVWLSRSALPGDTLYGLKRASENVQLATASSDTARADDYLQFANTRVAEVKALLAQSRTSAMGSKPGAAGGVDAQTTSLIESTLKSSDSDVRSAASLLGRAALQQHSDSPLQTMTSWAPTQLARLQAVWTAMPLGRLRTHAASSKALVTAAQHRATALHSLVRCACMSGASSDQLGPVPCKVCTSAPATKHGSQPTQHTGTRTGSTHTGSGSGASGSTGSAGGAKGGTATNGGAKGGTATNGSSSPGPNAPLPTSNLPKGPLPKITSALPKASIGSCGISVSIIGIGVDVDTCHK